MCCACTLEGSCCCCRRENAPMVCDSLSFLIAFFGGVVCGEYGGQSCARVVRFPNEVSGDNRCSRSNRGKWGRVSFASFFFFRIGCFVKSCRRFLQRVCETPVEESQQDHHSVLAQSPPQHTVASLRVEYTCVCVCDTCRRRPANHSKRYTKTFHHTSFQSLHQLFFLTCSLLWECFFFVFFLAVQDGVEEVVVILRQRRCGGGLHRCSCPGLCHRSAAAHSRSAAPLFRRRC